MRSRVENKKDEKRLVHARILSAIVSLTNYFSSNGYSNLRGLPPPAANNNTFYLESADRYPSPRYSAPKTLVGSQDLVAAATILLAENL
jgi:hypothetical protein